MNRELVKKQILFITLKYLVEHPVSIFTREATSSSSISRRFSVNSINSVLVTPSFLEVVLVVFLVVLFVDIVLLDVLLGAEVVADEVEVGGAQ